MWLDNAERIDIYPPPNPSRKIDHSQHTRVGGIKRSSDSYTPARIVLDASGSASVKASFAKYGETKIVPHFTIDPVGQAIYQHIDTDEVAPATAHRTKPHADGHTIWVAITKNTREILSAEASSWLGEAVATISEAVYKGRLTPVLRPYITSDPSAFTDSMSYAEWMTFQGVCGACHVPLIGEIGPGPFNYDAFLSTYHTEPEHASEEELAETEEPIEELPTYDPETQKIWTQEEAVEHWRSVTFSGRPLSVGSKGKAVQHLRGLYELGEGDFDEELEATIKDFQAKRLLEPTGVVDRETWDEIDLQVLLHLTLGLEENEAYATEYHQRLADRQALLEQTGDEDE